MNCKLRIKNSSQRTEQKVLQFFAVSDCDNVDDESFEIVSNLSVPLVFRQKQYLESYV